MFNLYCIGEKIKELRRKNKYSQEKLAEIIDVNFRTIQRIETGHNIPSLETLAKLADALNVDIQDFFNSEYLESRDTIIKKINNIMTQLNNEELRQFYKAIHTFYK